jgi:Nif11 domain
MSQETLHRFIEIVFHDATLQKRLWEASGLDAFVDLVQQLGIEQGYRFTAEDIKAALYVSRREWRERGELTTIQVELEGWIPIRVGQRGTQTVVEWCYRGTRRFAEPFFEQTVAACLRHPFNKLFRYQSPIGALSEPITTQPSLSPSGFIFHMSRCGSTLIAQLLASLPQAIVIAEAEPIDAVLRAHFRDPTVSDEQRCAWLQWVFGALGRRRDPQEQFLFIKFDSWSVMDLPLIQRAFPGVPWLFVYRDPIEVMVSHATMRGSQMVPGMIEPALLGLDASEIPRISLDEYCARTLASICGAAAQYGQAGDGRFVNYRQLPEVVWSSLLDFFGVTHTTVDVDRMRHVAQFHAKSPSTPFVGDASAKRHAATDDLRRLADQWVQRRYQRLIELQQAHETRQPTS